MTERRRADRVRLRCAVSLWKPGDGTVTHTETENLTSIGFFCLSSEEYLPGDELQATLEVPARIHKGRPTGSLLLRCQVEVVRMNSLPQSGVACRIKDYAVITPR